MGIAAISNDRSEVVCIDLADISFEGELELEGVFDNPQYAAIALAFNSNSPVYSYFLVSDDGDVFQAKENVVISNVASAGAYIFRDLETYIRALSHCLSRGKHYEHSGHQYVCPLFNGVIACGNRVAIQLVDNVQDVKIDDTLLAQ